jgi:hypothetical protein
LSEDKLRAEAERGRRMKEWAEGSGGLFEVFSAVEKDYLNTLLGSDIADIALREKIYHRVAALRDLRKVMETVIIAGRGASAQIEQMAKIEAKKQRKKATPDD